MRNREMSASVFGSSASFGCLLTSGEELVLEHQQKYGVRLLGLTGCGGGTAVDAHMYLIIILLYATGFYYYYTPF